MGFLRGLNWIACAVLAAPAFGQSDAELDWWRPDEIEVRLDVGRGLNGVDADQTELTAIPVWEVDLTQGVDLTVSARLRLDAADDLTPGRPNTGTYSPASRPVLLDDFGELELRDAYLDFDLGPSDVRLGKQQIVWGKLYGFKLLDAVNPQSFREFILEEFDQSRIGLWTLNVETPLPDGPLGSWELQTIWSPDTTVHRLAEPGATFEFQAPRFRFGQQPGDSPPDMVFTERPNDPFDDSVYGARLAGYVGGLDLSLNVLSGPDPQPLGRVELIDGQSALIRFHERRTLIGASMATSFGRLSTRAELGFSPDRSLNTRSVQGELDVEKADQLSIAFAADIAAPFGVTLSAQLLHDRILDAPNDIVRPSDDTLLSVLARRRFFDETLTVELRWYASEGGSDAVWRPKISYAVSDSLELSVDADVFQGNPDGIFGQFDERDRITVRIRRYF